MQQISLSATEGHLFGKIDGQLWLVDTGAPTSFGSAALRIDGLDFRPLSSYMGLTAQSLSELVGIACAGLLGADLLGSFDHLFDTANQTWTLSTGELECSGAAMPLEQFMGIPILAADIGGSRHRVFFDTGAQLSYWQDDLLATFPAAGRVEDFYPGVGRFETHTHMVDMSLGDRIFNLRCGRLPEILGATLMMAGTSGIVGNAVMMDRTTGFFPRRNTLRIS
jgi:hypothetical protein